MTTLSAPIRTAVIARANRRCEYCRIPDQLQIGGFEVDHIHPRSRGGSTSLDNLAFACPHCNNQKSDHVEHTDPASDVVVPLFHPRRQVWHEHFRWSPNLLLRIEGLTPSGRATVECLQLNHLDLVRIRRAFTDLGILVDDSVS